MAITKRMEIHQFRGQQLKINEGVERSIPVQCSNPGVGAGSRIPETEQSSYTYNCTSVELYKCASVQVYGE